MRLQLTRLLPLVLSASRFLPGVLGWGAAGHEIVATIAQIYTEPAALERLCQILQEDDTILDVDANHGFKRSQSWPCHLASVATWADRYKYRMRWSAPLHYVGAIGDHPADICMFPGSAGWEGKPNINVLGGIYNTSSILFDWVGGVNRNPAMAQEALKFLIHFIGDLHMPLHLTGRDRGGNGMDVCWDGRRTNLHSAWDTYIPAKAIRNVGKNYSRPLPFDQVEKNLRGAIYDPLIRRVVWEGIEGQWANELQDWASCPQTFEVENTEFTVLQTVFDFFLPGWLTRQNGETTVTDTDIVCPYHWAKPLHALNCELIWPKASDDGHTLFSRFSGFQHRPRRARCRRHHETDGQDEFASGEDGDEPPYELDNREYMGPIEGRMLLEQMFAQGGIRLATVLNHIFGTGNM